MSTTELVRSVLGEESIVDHLALRDELDRQRNELEGLPEALTPDR